LVQESDVVYIGESRPQQEPDQQNNLILDPRGNIETEDPIPVPLKLEESIAISDKVHEPLSHEISDILARKPDINIGITKQIDGMGGQMCGDDGTIDMLSNSQTDGGLGTVEIRPGRVQGDSPIYTWQRVMEEILSWLGKDGGSSKEDYQEWIQMYKGSKEACA
jgi:hypothetical protein